MTMKILEEGILIETYKLRANTLSLSVLD